MRIFFPLRSARWRIGAFAIKDEGAFMNSPTPWRPFAAPSPSISFKTAGSAASRCACSMESARPGAAITSKRFGRNDRTLNRAELRAFDLPRNRAQLACRIDLGLNAAGRISLDRGGVALGELVAWIIQGRQRELHHVSF